MARDWTQIGPSSASLQAPPPPRNDTPAPRYAATIYSGKSYRNVFTRLFWDPASIEFEDEYLVALALSARIFSITNHLSVEVEANVAHRFGNADIWEFSLPVFLRWDDFPWNDSLYTTFGLALIGPSIVTEISDSERRKAHADKGSHFLNTFIPEITLSPPDDRNFAFIARVHHRSGIFGLINGVSGGSSYVSLGVRYRF